MRAITCFTTLIGFAGVLFAQTQTYRDPAGRFSIPVPPGWTVKPLGEMLQLQSGNAYTLVTVIPGGGDDPHRIARFTDDFGKQWKAYERKKTGLMQVGGTEGAYAIYTGVNARGVDSLVKALSVPLGSSAVVVLTYCPMAEWESKRQVVEGALESGFMVGRGSPNAPPAPSNSDPTPAPQFRNTNNNNPSTRQLPQGFSIKAVNGNSGQAMTATFSAEFVGKQSARKAFNGVYQLVESYFDSKPQLLSAIADARDTQVEAFFRAVWGGTRVRGIMVLAVENGRGYTGVVFDREDLAANSLPGMMRQISTAFGSGAPNPAGRPAARPAPLSQTPLPDGSGAVGLPPGWRITGAYKGTVDISGPAGEGAAFGAYNVVYTQPLPGLPPNVPTGPYRPPAGALVLYYDTTSQHALSRGLMNLRVIEQAPAATDAGQAAYILYEVTSQTHSYRGLAMVSCRPIDQSQWMMYMSMVSSPTQAFAQTLPTMWEMWKSWTVNPAVFRERMDQAVQSMRETSQIIQGAYENRQRTNDNVNTAWSQAMRGVTSIEDLAGQRRWDVDTGSAQDMVNRLNEQGYQFRVVPLPELVR